MAFAKPLLLISCWYNLKLYS